MGGTSPSFRRLGSGTARESEHCAGLAAPSSLHPDGNRGPPLRSTTFPEPRTWTRASQTDAQQPETSRRPATGLFGRSAEAAKAASGALGSLFINNASSAQPGGRLEAATAPTVTPTLQTAAQLPQNARARVPRRGSPSKGRNVRRGLGFDATRVLQDAVPPMESERAAGYMTNGRNQRGSQTEVGTDDHLQAPSGGMIRALRSRLQFSKQGHCSRADGAPLEAPPSESRTTRRERGLPRVRDPPSFMSRVLFRLYC